jgi:hypothetical protein
MKKGVYSIDTLQAPARVSPVMTPFSPGPGPGVTTRGKPPWSFPLWFPLFASIDKSQI